MKIKSTIENISKKDLVLDILKLLEGKSYGDCVEIIDAAKYFLKCSTLDIDNVKAELEELLNE